MDEQLENATTEANTDQTPHPLEEGLDVYPLRDPSEDPRWALRTIWTWVSISIFLLLFIVTMIILGLWYD